MCIKISLFENSWPSASNFKSFFQLLEQFFSQMVRKISETKYHCAIWNRRTNHSCKKNTNWQRELNYKKEKREEKKRKKCRTHPKKCTFSTAIYWRKKMRATARWKEWKENAEQGLIFILSRQKINLYVISCILRR